MLKKLLELVSFSNGRELSEDKAVINKNIILAKSPDGTVAVRVELKKELFDQKIGIPVKKTLNFLNLFKEPVIKIKENRLIIQQGKKKISVLLVEPSLVKSAFEEAKFASLKENLVGAEVYTANLDTIKEVLSKYFALGEPISQCTFEKEELTFEIGNDNTNNIVDTIEVKGNGSKVSVKLGQAFIDAISVLEGEAAIFVKENKPILVSKETDDYRVEILIAQVG